MTEIGKYKKYLRSKGLKAKTIKTYLWHLDQFLLWLDDQKLTENILRNYLQFLLKKYPRVSTINLRLIIINNYLKFLGRRFRFEVISSELIPAQMLSKKELEKFLKQPEKNKTILGLRDKALLELLYWTGLKVGQITEIKTDQIDEIKKELILSSDKIAINPSAWFYLKKYLEKRSDKSPWLFINFDRSQKSGDSQLSIRSVERLLDKYAKNFDPPIKINPQILRNTLAYQLKLQGAREQDFFEQLHYRTKTGAKIYYQKI